MKKLVNGLMLAMIPLYLLEIVCAGLIILKSQDYFALARIVGWVFMALWVVCLLLASRMTKLQNTIFLAISICGVCAMVPGVICLLFTSGWLSFPPVLLPIVIALSPFAVSLTYFPAEALAAHWNLLACVFLLVFVVGTIWSFWARRRIGSKAGK